jgi:hypothetical protein
MEKKLAADFQVRLFAADASSDNYYLKAAVPECWIEHLMNAVTVLCIIDCG